MYLSSISNIYSVELFITNIWDGAYLLASLKERVVACRLRETGLKI
jgi:hypothetical protein